MPSSSTVLNTLAWLRAQNLSPVPLNYKTKEYYTTREYSMPSAKHVYPDILWRENQLNIGMFTGLDAGGAIDVDLDCDEAAKLARFFLSNKAVIFGRAARPNSHYLYRSSTDKFAHFEFRDPTPRPLLVADKPGILEIRGENCQTMMPGSVHPSGEVISWYTQPSHLVNISLAQIQSECKMLAAAVLAARYMWLDGERHDTCMQLAALFYSLKLPQAACENFISALIAFSGSDDPAHLATIRTTYTRLATDKPARGVNTLRERFKSTNPEMIKLFLKLLGYGQEWLDSFNDRYATVLIGSKYKIAILPIKSGDPLVFIGKDDFKDLTAGVTIKAQIYKKDGSPVDGETKSVPVADLWLKSPQRRHYSKVVFRPGVSQAHMEDGHLNEWTGYPLQPKDAFEKCKAFREWVEDYLTDPKYPEQARWVYTYFAHILREPLNKQRAALVIIGPEKIGKTVFVNYFGKILGDSHINIADVSKIHGRFNYHLKMLLLLHSEEAVHGSDKRHRSIIKDLISNKKMQFEAKYGGIESGESFLRLIYTSNEIGAAPIALGDTRHTVFNFNISGRIPPRGLIKRLYEESISDGPAALMSFLLNLPSGTWDEETKAYVAAYQESLAKIKKFKSQTREAGRTESEAEKAWKHADKAQHAHDALYMDYNPSHFYDPELLTDVCFTREKQASITSDLDVLDQYWMEKLRTGELLHEKLRWAAGSVRGKDYQDENVKWPNTFARPALYADYLEKCNIEKIKEPWSSFRFFQRLESWLGGPLVFKSRTYTNPFIGDLSVPKLFATLSSRTTAVVVDFPPLDKCREAFDKYAGGQENGQSFSWPSVEFESDDDPATLLLNKDAANRRY